MKIRFLILCIFVMSVALTATLAPGKARTNTPTLQSSPAPAHQIEAAYGRLPLQFEANQGQVDASVKFLARGRGYNLFLTSTEAVLVLSAATTEGMKALAAGESSTARDELPAVLRLQFLGANPEPEVAGQEKLPGVVNYYLGHDPDRWRTGIPTFAQVKYQGVYPGVDVVFYGNGRQLEYDFVVAPAIDPSHITLGAQGADALAVDASGDLVLQVLGGAMRLRKPFIYQEVNGVRQQVGGGYVLKGEHQFGFQVAAYDASQPLIIDPVLEYSTYFGGSGADYGYGIAVDAAGSVYLTGATNSTDFPLVNPAQPDFGGGGVNCPSDMTPYRLCYDAFVTKLNPLGSALVYSTYLGLPGDDEGRGIAVDAAGNAYMTGYISLNSESLPDYYIYEYVLVVKLDATGAFSYVAWFGNEGSVGNGIAVDSAGRAYVTGEAHGRDFPTTPGAIQPTEGELIDGFVSVLDPTGSFLAYSTYLGGSGEYCDVCYSVGYGIAVDNAGMIYVTGQAAPSFPTTPNAYQSAFAGVWNAFVAKIDPSQSGAAGLVYATYLGGEGNEFGKAIALDAAGKVYVTGSTQSDDFPTTPGAFDRTCGTDGICNATDNMVCDPVPPGHPDVCHLDSKADVFVAKMDLSRSGAASLAFATYIGGSGKDRGSSIAVDAAGNAYVTGSTVSPDFPMTSPLQAIFGGNLDAFVLKLNAAGSGLDYSTYMGGGGDDEGYAIAVDSTGNAHVTGYTGSQAFPVANPLQPRAGSWEAFIAKIRIPLLTPRLFLPIVIR